MQHMRYYSHAYCLVAHEMWIMCSTRKYNSRAVHESLLACSPFRVTCEFVLSHATKFEEHMCVQQTRVSI